MKTQYALLTVDDSMLSGISCPRLIHRLCLAFASLVFACGLPALASSEDMLLVTRFENVDINIDGIMDEPEWASLPLYDQLTVLDPDTLVAPELKTHYRFLYTDEGLYVGIWNEQAPETFISRLSPRDDFMTRDDISFTLDPTGKGLYGYWFNLALSGAVIDGTVVPERQFSSRWDGPWHGATSKLSDGWSAEMFLPWSMMSMPEAEGNRRQMGFYMSRSYASKGERWGHPALPSSKGVFLSQLQKMELQNVNPSSQFTFYPFSAGTYDRINHHDTYKAGFDLFWRPSTNLQLTSTINPDFGNVESDSIVVNLTSFETFFSEKRAFFLEGQEIFTTSPRNLGGFRSIAPTSTLLNTRRIGSPPRAPEVDGFELPGLERNQPTALQGAAKVTGQQGRVRYGLLAAAEKDTKLTGSRNDAPFDVLADGRDFGVARVLYEDTSTGARRSLGWMTTLVAHPKEDAIVHGLDAHLLTRGGGFAFDAQLMASDTNSESGAGAFVDFSFTPKQGRQHSLQFDYFDENLDINDFGFLRRNDAKGFRYGFERSDSSLQRLKTLYSRIQVSKEYNSDGQDIGGGISTQQELLFDNNHLVAFELDYLPSHWDDRNSSGNGDYRVDEAWKYGIQWRNSRADRLNVRLSFRDFDEALGGSNRQYETRFTWRPIDRFAMDLRLRYEQRDGWLVHSGSGSFTTYAAEIWRPQIDLDYFISAKQEFRISAQWAGIKAFEQKRWLIPAGDGDLVRDPEEATTSRDFSISRISFQARYRWEIAPLSDLFVVYTRGSNVPSDPAREFDDLLSAAWSEPAVEVLVVKLRYRLGS